MGKHMRNGEPYTYYPDDTIRYVRNPESPNFDWVQVKDADGNWINDHRAYTQRRDLYMTTANEGNFEAYNGSDQSVAFGTQLPSVTFGETFKFGVSHSAATAGASVISELIDLSRFKKIKLHHKSTISHGDGYHYVSLFVTSARQQYMGNKIVASTKLITSAGTENEDAELDISAIEGEYYIGICCHCNVGSASTEISNMYME